MNMKNIPHSNYKWYILALGTFTHIFVVALPWMSMPVLFDEMSKELGLSLVEIGTAWGMVSFAGIFTAFTSGMIADRFGTRKTISMVCLLMGISGALRGLATDFTSLCVLMFLFGICTVPMTFFCHKAVGEWFTGRELGMANGVLAMGMGCGIALGTLLSGTVFSPLLGGWRNLLFVYGILGLIGFILWIMTKPNTNRIEASQRTETVPFRQSLSHVARIRSVWFIAVAWICTAICRGGFSGYLPLYLLSIGWAPVSADGALSALSAASVIGVVPLSLLSDRLGRRKVVAYMAMLFIVIGIGGMSFITGPVVWLLVIMVGLGQEALAAILITMVMETKGIGAKYSGTALGLGTAMALMGGTIGPPVGNALAEINPGYAFIFWAGMVAIGLIVFRFAEETGWRRRSSEIV